MDPASATSLIVDDVRKQLQLTGPNMPLKLSWTNGNIQDEPHSQIVSLRVRGPNNKMLNIKNLRSVKELDLPRQTVDAKKLSKMYSYS